MKTETIACSVEGCETIAKTIGLCNTHYMAQWRTQQRQIENELTDVIAINKAPATDFVCDRCEEAAVVWWVRGGNIKDAVVLCREHRDSLVEEMRLDIRRLELKQ